MPRKSVNAEVESSSEDVDVDSNLSLEQSNTSESVSDNSSTEINVGYSSTKFQDQIDEVVDRAKRLREYIHTHMVENEDYGKIPGFGEKLSLFKSGAEKLNALFKVAPRITVTNRLEDWTGSSTGLELGFVSYEVKVQLVSYADDSRGVVMGEGIGLANSQDKMFKSRTAYLMANNVLKMAKKRALVDASLSNSLASGMFTQDIEDMGNDTHTDTANKKYAPPPLKAQQALGISGEAASSDDEVLIGFGTFKGKRLQEVPETNLNFYISAATKNYKENKFVDQQIRFLKAAFNELDVRGVTEYDKRFAAEIRAK